MQNGADVEKRSNKTKLFLFNKCLKNDKIKIDYFQILILSFLPSEMDKPVEDPVQTMVVCKESNCIVRDLESCSECGKSKSRIGNTPALWDNINFQICYT